MYSPIIWANPYRLKLVREENRRYYLNKLKFKKPEREQQPTKEKAFSMLYKSFAIGRMF
jgi:hypothetical protein